MWEANYTTIKMYAKPRCALVPLRSTRHSLRFRPMARRLKSPVGLRRLPRRLRPTCAYTTFPPHGRKEDILYGSCSGNDRINAAPLSDITFLPRFSVPLRFLFLRPLLFVVGCLMLMFGTCILSANSLMNGSPYHAS